MAVARPQPRQRATSCRSRRSGAPPVSRSWCRQGGQEPAGRHGVAADHAREKCAKNFIQQGLQAHLLNGGTEGLTLPSGLTSAHQVLEAAGKNVVNPLLQDCTDARRSAIGVDALGEMFTGRMTPAESDRAVPEGRRRHARRTTPSRSTSTSDRAHLMGSRRVTGGIIREGSPRSVEMQHGKYRFIAGFLALPLLLYAIFVISPFVQAIQISFTDWAGPESRLQDGRVRNFELAAAGRPLLERGGAQRSLLLVLPLVTLGLGLFFAFMLNVGGRGRKNAAVTGVRGSSVYKVVYFFPQVLSVAIVAAAVQVHLQPATAARSTPSSAARPGRRCSSRGWATRSFALWCVWS